MKKIFIILFFVFSTVAFAQESLPNYGDYVGTTWKIRPASYSNNEYVEFSVKFGRKAVLMIIESCDYTQDGNPDKPCEIKKYSGKNPKVVPPYTSQGIHANMPAIIAFNKRGNMAFFINNEECLLLPDTSAPGDCLRKVE